MPKVSASEALQRLKAGNEAFRSQSGSSVNADASSLQKHAEGQHPFAIILGCADSRVPPEIIFDQGIGDLFVVRVAGNIVTPSQIGSIEFAAENFGSRLIVVLGHSLCGAVTAAMAELENPSGSLSPHLSSIVDSICPAIESLAGDQQGVDEAIRANVMASVNKLGQESSVLGNLMENDGLEIVGACYSLETGVVQFFDN